MAVSLTQVRAALMPEEPDYSRAAELGPEALPHLHTLVREAEPMLASKATYLASLIDHADAVEVVKEAAESGDPVIKVAAAAAAGNLSAQDAADVLIPLMADADVGVRKTAIKSVSPDATPALRSALQRLGDEEGHPGLRELSGHMLGMVASFAGQPSSARGVGTGEGGGTVDVGLSAGAPGSTATSGLLGDGGGWIAGDRSASADREDAEDGGGDLDPGGGSYRPAAPAPIVPAGGGDVGTTAERSGYRSGGEGGGSAEAGPASVSPGRSGRTPSSRRRGR